MKVSISMGRRLRTLSELKALAAVIAKSAQHVYDKWDEADTDTYASGGICHLISDAICDILQSHGIECSPVSSSHEQHVYVVAKLKDGVFSVDIHHSLYETGGGFRWKKIPNVEFDHRDVDFYCITRDPSEFDQIIGD